MFNKKSSLKRTPHLEQKDVDSFASLVERRPDKPSLDIEPLKKSQEEEGEIDSDFEVEDSYVSRPYLKTI